MAKQVTLTDRESGGIIYPVTTASSVFKDTKNVDTLLDEKINLSSKGKPDGIAELDSSGKIPSAQLPSYVDEIIEGTLTTFPTKGESGKIYVDTGTNKTYRWSGSSYVEISASLALGETSATAYSGDKGKAVTDGLAAHKNDKANPHIVTKAQVGLSNVDNTSDLNKPISTAVATKFTEYTNNAQLSRDYLRADGTGVARGHRGLALTLDSSLLDIVGMQLNTGGVARGSIGYEDSTGVALYSMGGWVGISKEGVLKVNDHIVWHAGNDGAGSGLDADTLDGMGSSDFSKAITLGSTNLNSVIGHGIGKQVGSTEATPENNYPIKEGGLLIYGDNVHNRSSQIYGSHLTNRWFARSPGPIEARTPWKEFAFKTDNVASADKLSTARNISLSDAVTATTVSFNGTNDIDIPITRLDPSKLILDGDRGDIATRKSPLVWKTGTTNTKGAVKIDLPYNAGSGMRIIEMNVYEYNSNAASKIILGWHNYSKTPPGFYQHGVSILGNFKRRIRVADLGENLCIILGDVTDTMSYLHIDVISDTQGYSFYSFNFLGKWKASIITEEPVFINVVEPVPNNNVVVQKAREADKLAIARTINGIAFDGTSNITLPSTTYGPVTTTTDGLMIAEDKLKLNSIAFGAQVNTVYSVNNKQGSVVLSKADIGLSNVDNTPDTTKNVLSAMQLTTPRNIQLSGSVNSDAVAFDGSKNVDIVVKDINPSKVNGSFLSDNTNMTSMIRSHPLVWTSEQKVVSGALIITLPYKVASTPTATHSHTHIIEINIFEQSTYAASKLILGFGIDNNTNYPFSWCTASVVGNYDRTITFGRQSNGTLCIVLGEPNQVTQAVRVDVVSDFCFGSIETVPEFYEEWYANVSTYVPEFTYSKSPTYNNYMTVQTAREATKLVTPRNINGVAFDGTADIDLPLASDFKDGLLSRFVYDRLDTQMVNDITSTVADGLLNINAVTKNPITGTRIDKILNHVIFPQNNPFGSTAPITNLTIPLRYRSVTANLSVASTIQFESAPLTGSEYNIRCVPTASFVQPIPNTGNWSSMSGSSYSAVSGKVFEINIWCYSRNSYSIVVRESD